MKTFKLLPLLFLIFLCSIALGQKKATIETTLKVQSIDEETDESSNFVTAVRILEDKNPAIEITSLNDIYTQWEIKSPDLSGKIALKTSRMDGIWWECLFNKDTVIVEISKNQATPNDPRVMAIVSASRTLYMANQEPDCNSVFYLYEKPKEGIEEYEFDEMEPLIKGSTDACGKEGWGFSIKSKITTKNERIALYFASALAMNLRYIEALDKDIFNQSTE